MEGCKGESSGSKGEDPKPQPALPQKVSIWDDDDNDDEPSSHEKIPSSGSEGVKNPKNPKAENLELPSSDCSTPSLSDQIQELQRKLALAKKEYTAKRFDWSFRIFQNCLHVFLSHIFPNLFWKMLP